MPFLNEIRLRNYPKLFLIAIWSVILVNILFHRGWVGRFGGIIGVDFVCIYSGGSLYRYSIQNLYNIQAQAENQQELFQPTPLGGTVNIFTHPPYAALAYSMLTFLPLGWAFAIWTVLSCFSCGFALFLIRKCIFPLQLKNKISFLRLAIIIFSSIPFVTGLFFGQSHWLTFLLMTGIVVSMMYDRWFLAGILAGLLIFKPHFIIGYLILWLVWKKYKSILGFSMVAIPWAVLVIFQHGFHPYQSYLNVLALITKFAVTDTIIWEVTPYALIQTILNRASIDLSMTGIYLFAGLTALGLAIWSNKNDSKQNRTSSIILATLFPYIASPHVLLYDLLPITIIFALWSRMEASSLLLNLAIFTYISSFILPAATKFSGIALLALIPLITLAALVFYLSKPTGSLKLEGG